MRGLSSREEGILRDVVKRYLTNQRANEYLWMNCRDELLAAAKREKISVPLDVLVSIVVQERNLHNEQFE